VSDEEKNAFFKQPRHQDEACEHLAEYLEQYWRSVSLPKSTSQTGDRSVPDPNASPSARLNRVGLSDGNALKTQGTGQPGGVNWNPNEDIPDHRLQPGVNVIKLFFLHQC
jgi:hypothetical protein